MASIYIARGDFDEAKKSLKICIKANPKFMQAHRSLARITTYNKTDNVHVNQVINLLKSTDDKDINNKIELSFALGKAFEDLRDFKKSFSYYMQPLWITVHLFATDLVVFYLKSLHRLQ